MISICKLFSNDDDDDDRKENMNLDCKQIQTLPKMLKMRMFVKDMNSICSSFSDDDDDDDRKGNMNLD